ncbi:hypothetical protein [Plantactinospora sp. WMMB782]|uniref:hypothetical protein n=1 Tax=Plantactinospora sp. WMMB782 TaxID=3404121 RepID=UPI003B92C3C5
MDHRDRDRGRGELARHEWQESAGRGDPTPSWSDDPYSRPDVTYRTPSRRRARRRGAPEPVDSYTPSWARESTEPLRSTTPGPYPDSTDRPAWSADPEPGGLPGGRHQRPDAATGSATESGRVGRRRVAPDVTWDSSGEYWRGPSAGTGDDTGAGQADDTWRTSGGTAGAAAERTQDTWRTSGGTAGAGSGAERTDDPWGASSGGAGGTGGWRDGVAGSGRSAATGSAAAAGDEFGVAGRHGRRRTGTGRHSDEADDWAAAAPTSGWVGDVSTSDWAAGTAPTSGWVGAAPTTGAGADAPTSGGWAADPPASGGWAADPPASGGWAADAPTSGGWAADAPTSGGWAADAPTTGAGANSGPGGRSASSRRGRRRRADPDDDPTAVPTSGWGVGAAESPAGDSDRRNRADPTGWRERVDEPGAGRWGRVGEREEGTTYGSAQPVPGRRRRAEPAGWDPDDPTGTAPPGRRSRHRAEDPPEVAERPDATASAEPVSGAGQSRSAARWVRSADETGSGGGRRSRGADPLSKSGGTGARRRRSEPDAEPVRRSREAGPVRRAGADPDARGDRDRRARHSGSGAEERRWDATSPGWRTDAGPWDRLTDTGMLDPVADSDPPDRSGSGRRRDRSTDTGQFDRFTDSGQWDRFTDTTEWRRGELAGLAPDARPGRDDSARSGREDQAGSGFREAARGEPDAADTFWSGTRLAGDDPRWMGIPDSAPRSPAVAYPPPARPVSPARRPSEPTSPGRRPAGPPGRGRPGTAGSARGVGAVGTTTRRRTPGDSLLSPVNRTGRPSPLSRRLEDDLLDSQPSGSLPAVLYTAAWNAVAVLAIFVWVLTLDGSVPVDCVPGASGACESERGQAISALLAGVPRFLAALATGLVVAVLMRWFNRTWRAVTVGFAAAVVGGGLSTVFFTALSGQPIS